MKYLRCEIRFACEIRPDGRVIDDDIRIGDMPEEVLTREDYRISRAYSGTVTFANTATALSSVDMGKLFARFFRVDSARKSTGSGLSIAKLLTERMHGTIGTDTA